MGAPMTSGSFTNVTTVGIREVFFNSYDEVITKEAMVPRIFGMTKSSKQNEYALSVSALGDYEDFTATGQLTYDDIAEGYKKTFTHNEWTKAFKIRRALKDDDLYSIFDNLVSQRGTAAARTREKHGASIFIGAFAGTSGPDSLSLCNSAHTSTVSGVSTQSNTGTDTLSKTTVSSARLAMMKFNGLNGERIGVMGDTLIVPLDKEEDAWVIISSKGEPETDVNNANFHYGKYKLIVWPDLTSQYDWFICDSRLMKKSLLWFDRVALELNEDVAFNTYESRYSAYMRYTYGWIDWSFVYGNDATS